MVSFNIFQNWQKHTPIHYNIADEWIFVKSSKLTHQHSRTHKARNSRSVHHHKRSYETPFVNHSDPANDFDDICSLEIVETIPQVLSSKGYANNTSISHLSIQKVNS